MTPVSQTYTYTSDSAMPVKVEIIQACTISASDLAFGPYDSSSSTPKLGQTAIQLTCGVGVHVELSLDGGTGPGGNTSRRRMRQDSGTDRLDYGLFQDPGRNVPWGDSSGVDTLEMLSTGVTQNVPVYGEIPANQRAREGTYSDEITVRLQF
jgi:spore coat protein U-like protein